MRLIESEREVHQNILSSTNAYVCNVSRYIRGREMNVFQICIFKMKKKIQIKVGRCVYPFKNSKVAH